MRSRAGLKYHDMNKKDLIKIAKQKVKDKKKFHAHLNAFCIVTVSLFLINYFTTPGTWWFILPIIGWAMAVLGHYLTVFGLPSFTDEIWEAEQFEIEMEKLEKTQNLDYQTDEILDISNDKLELRESQEIKRNYNSDDYV